MESYFASACLLAFVAVVAVVDLTTRRIPNWLTVTAAAVALALNISRLGGHGVLASGAGLLTGVAAFLPLYLTGGFGAGDIKAMGAVGAFLGPKGVLIASVWTLLVGGLCALAVLVAFRWKTAHAKAGWLKNAGQQPFPYGLAIALGTALSVVWS
jgi:prepilin peptidase CpaA